MMRDNDWKVTLDRLRDSDRSAIHSIYLLSSMSNEEKQEVLNEFLIDLVEEDDIQLIRVPC
jgi:hypothetical protein